MPFFNRTEYVVRLQVFIEAIFPHQLRHQLRSGLSPDQLFWFLRLADAQSTSHYFTSSGDLNDAIVDKYLRSGRLAGEDVLLDKIEWTKAHNIRIGPPTTML